MESDAVLSSHFSMLCIRNRGKIPTSNMEPRDGFAAEEERLVGRRCRSAQGSARYAAMMAATFPKETKDYLAEDAKNLRREEVRGPPPRSPPKRMTPGKRVHYLELEEKIHQMDQGPYKLCCEKKKRRSETRLSYGRFSNRTRKKR
jgi:hypothetical protein